MNTDIMDKQPIVKLTSGALIIALFSVASRLMGVVRDRMLAHTYGAGVELDAYYAAFRIPDFIFNTIVLGAVASAFIPVFLSLKRERAESAMKLAHTLMTGIVMMLIFWAILGIILAPQLMALIAPGFDIERLALAIKLTRIMLIATIFFGASNVVGSILQADRRFTAFAAAPMAYNVGIIAGLLMLVPRVGPIGLAWGVVAGSILHLIVQLPAAWRSGFGLKLSFAFNNEAVRRVGSLLAPRTLGLAAAQFNQLMTAGFISHLSVGTLTAFALATNLQSFPISVFGVSLAVAAFPVFSQAFGEGDHNNFRQHFEESVRRILFFVLPMAVLFLVLRAQIVRVVLGSGSFDWADTIRTAQALGFLALAMVSDSLVPLVARVFYALQDTRTPVIISVVSILVNFVLLISLSRFGLAGIGMAYVASSVTNLGLLLAVLGKKLPNLGADVILRGSRTMTAAAVVAGAGAYATLRTIAPLVNMRTFLGIATQGLVAGLVDVACYLIIVLAWRLPEVEFVRRWLRSAWKVIRPL